MPSELGWAIKSILDNDGNGVQFQILSNPEFCWRYCRRRFIEPDRILIGGDISLKDKKSNAVSSVEVHANGFLLIKY
jgi:UDPglucose 6-dehydrogenase